MNNARHEIFMYEAIKLARDKMNAGCGGPFGAIIVKNNEIIAQGWNQVTSTKDPSAHAEVSAIRNACQSLNDFNLAGCDIYTSCEPCPMCLGAIYWARLDNIYFAADRHDAKKIGFDDALFYNELQKNLTEREVPMVSISRQEALKVFQEWDDKSDKIIY